MPSFLSELRHRNVLRVAAGYALVAWIIIEAGSVLMPTFGAPEWAFRAYVIVVIAGFLVALILAWIFELTPDGVKLEKDVDRSVPATGKSNRKLNLAFVFLLLVALAVSVTLNITGMRELGAPGIAQPSRTSIAVLPFTSRSLESQNALFADGMHDDLLTRLANISALKVISRTSVMEYRDTTKNLRQVGEELGVDTILEGAVQRVGNSVRVNAQLIDATTDEHLWGKTYDSELTAESLFEIQSDISAQISNALRAVLSDDERSRIAEVPTQNIAAYSAFTEGRQDLHERTLEKLLRARERFEKAIELDPNYAAAYSGLADSLALLFINHTALTMEQAFEPAQEALDTALELDPNLADAYASQGLIYTTIWLQTRTDTLKRRAVDAFRTALSISPNHARAAMWYASLRGSEGKIDEAIRLYNRALEIDPLARIPYANLPPLYARQGRNEEALQSFLDAVEIYPDWPTVHSSIAVHLQGLGRVDEAIAWARKARELTSDPLNGVNIIGAYLQLGDTETAVAMMRNFDIEDDHPFARFGPGLLHYFTGEYQRAITEMETVIEASDSSASNFLYSFVAQAALLTGDYDKAYRYLLRGNPALSDHDELVVDVFNVADVIKLAYLLQQRGDHDEAGRLLSAALPVVRSMPRLGVAGYGIRDVQILSLQGRKSDALNLLRQAVDEGFRGSLFFDNWRLAEDPFLAPLRDDPGFAGIQDSIGAFNREMRENVQQAELFDDWDALRARASETADVAMFR